MNGCAAISSFQPPPRALHHLPPRPISAPPWPRFPEASPPASLYFQYPCGTCRRLFLDEIVVPCSPCHLSLCPCSAPSFCHCKNCDAYFCASCFKASDDCFLTSLQLADTDFHPFTMRNFPQLYEIEHGDDSPEPQVQMQFALYVPKSCLEIVLEFPPPWRNICVSRKGVHYFPAAQCPEPTHFDIRARSPLSVACSRAREALRLAEQNRSAEIQESQRLEYESDIGVPLDRFRNVSPSSLRYFQEASRHRPLYTADDPVLSQYRLDAFNAKYDLPPFISWPVLLNNSSPFPWCCGACRFKKNAILLPTTTLITLPTPPICPA
jgi:hypothetical protein